MHPKREAILHVVLDFLTGKHEEKLTVANVARVLEIGKSTVYEYFSEKETMIAEAILMMIDENVAYMSDPKVYENLDFEKAFTVYMERSFMIAKGNRMMENMLQNTDLMRIASSHKEAIQEKIMIAYTDIQKHVKGIFNLGVEEGLFSKEASKMRSLSIESMLFGSVFMVTKPNQTIDESKFIDDLLESVFILLR